MQTVHIIYEQACEQCGKMVKNKMMLSHQCQGIIGEKEQRIYNVLSVVLEIMGKSHKKD